MADKTIDLRIKFTDHAGTETIVCHYEDGSNFWALDHVDGSGLRFRIVSGGVDIVSIIGGETTDTLWHHIALVKVGNDYGIYLDGSQVAFVSDSDLDTFTGSLILGNLSGSNYLDGYIDEFRIRNDNFFDASPVVGLTDTIRVPTFSYIGDALFAESASITLLAQDVCLASEYVIVCGSADINIQAQSATFTPKLISVRPAMSVDQKVPYIEASLTAPRITATLSVPYITLDE